MTLARLRRSWRLGRPATRVLVLGRDRAARSLVAERMLEPYPVVVRVASDPADERSAPWQQWRSLDIAGLAAALAEPGGPPLLVDSLVTWLGGQMERCGTWDGRPAGPGDLAALLDDLVSRWRLTSRYAVVLSDRVGAGSAPATDRGRRLWSELGRLNARIARDSDQVWLCPAATGIPRRLK